MAGARRRGPHPGVVAVSLAVAALIAFGVWAGIKTWRLAGPAHVSVHGYIAMAIAAVGVVGLGGGLIWLAYYSARKGYDDEQGVL